MQTMFNYDQGLASQIGEGKKYTSGGYVLKIVRAQFKDNKFLEFDFEEKEGRKFQYVSINYQKNDGSANDYGWKMINAIMGCVGVKTLSCDNNGMCPELHGKLLKAVLQRVDKTKSQGANAGKDYFEFEFKMPADLNTGKTVKEMIEGKPAEAFDRFAESIEDRDERQKDSQNKNASSVNSGWGHHQTSSQPQHNGPMLDFDDDIPFAPIGLQFSKLIHCI